MAEYSVSVNANSAASTEFIFIELVPAASTSIYIKKITVGFTNTLSDGVMRVRVYRETTAGSGGVAFTPVEQNPGGAVATTTCNIKTGSTTFSLGTTTDKLLDCAFNSRGNFEWIARDKTEYLWSNEAERLVVAITYSNVAVLTSVSCFFEE